MSRICLIGKGKWGTKLHRILSEEGLLADWPSISKRAPGEPIDQFRERVGNVLRNSRGDIVWLAVPPIDQDIMVNAAIDAGRNVVIEKPWLVLPSESSKILQRAQNDGLFISVSYIYCFLDNVIDAANRDSLVSGFEGRFLVASKNHLGLSSLDNLGSHLLALRQYINPQSTLLNLETGYDSDNYRAITLHYCNKIKTIDFSNSNEPIVQRFASSFINSINIGQPFTFDLTFASAIFDDLQKYEHYNTL